MMPEMTVVGVAPDLPLGDLQLVVQQQEEILGPLVSIGNDGGATLLTFDLDQERPQHPTLVVTGGTRTPLGYRRTFTGKAFVNGRLEDLVGYRPPG